MSLKYLKILIVLLIIFYPFFSLSTPTSAQTLVAPHKKGELLVKLKTSPSVYKFKFSNSSDLQKLINFYSSYSEIEYVEPNYIYTASLEPRDPYYTQQLHLTQIKAHQAWNITTGSPKITIAIIDSGVNIDHPDLKNNIWINSDEIPNNGLDDDENGYTDDYNGWDFITSTNNPRPQYTTDYSETAIHHGTVVAGLAAAQGGNNEGIAGVTWSAQIMPLRVLDEQGTGDTNTVAQAIDYARNMGADIINLSFVGSGRSLTLEKAIQNAYNAGILVIAAAGNEILSGVNMDQTPEYPVCHDGPNGENWVIGVASVDNNNKLASFSNYGKSCVDLTAPGLRLTSTLYYDENSTEFNKAYGTGWTGTSVSAPQVSGAAALIKSLNSNLSVSQIRDLILNNATNIDNLNLNYRNLLGQGLLNVYASLSKTLLEKPHVSVGPSSILTSPGQNGGPHVRIFKKFTIQNQFFAFDEDFRGNLNVAAGDLDNDGQSEILTGLGQGTYPWIKIFNSDGTLKDKIVAYAEDFRGGVEVATGDVDGDGLLDIISAPGPGGGPHIRIFSNTGFLKSQFFAFDKQERTGLEIASADLTNDGNDEIIIVRKSGPPEVKIFNYRGHQIANFLAYDPKLTTGIHIAAGDLNGDSKAEIVTGPGQGGGPHVRVFDLNGSEISSFFAYSENFRGGVYVAVGDINDDGINDIITGAGPTGGPHVRVFDKNGGVQLQFFAYDKNFRGGVRVASEK